LAVNTIIERKGAVAALLVTRGFRDVLNIGRHRIPDVFNFFAELPVPLVPRSRVLEIAERTLADGRVAERVDEAEVGRAVDRLVVYFEDLERGLRDLGVAAPVLSTKSNGGVMTAAEAGRRPVETLLSGPAAGVIGASFVARQAGWERVITFDMGGTSADVAVVDGEPRFSTENHVGDFPVIMPAIDVTSIGAGGGSVAWTDRDGVLKVGPHSAGARPGPACY